jgi:hypothetical protein
VWRGNTQVLFKTKQKAKEPQMTTRKVKKVASPKVTDTACPFCGFTLTQKKFAEAQGLNPKMLRQHIKATKARDAGEQGELARARKTKRIILIPTTSAAVAESWTPKGPSAEIYTDKAR